MSVLSPTFPRGHLVPLPAHAVTHPSLLPNRVNNSDVSSCVRNPGLRPGANIVLAPAGASSSLVGKTDPNSDSGRDNPMGHLTVGSRQDHNPEQSHSEVWKMSGCCFPVGGRGPALLVAETTHIEAEQRGVTGTQEMERRRRGPPPDQGALNGRLWSFALFCGQWGAGERLSVVAQSSM